MGTVIIISVLLASVYCAGKLNLEHPSRRYVRSIIGKDVRPLGF